MNILVLSDNPEVLARAKPIFLKRKDVKYCFTNSLDKDPKKDYEHIIRTFDLVFSLHCRRIFPRILIQSKRCINIHPGFNPYNRGIYPHVFSIVNGLPAGVTIHEMIEEIDLGPWICQHEVDIKYNDTSESLYKRIIDKEMALLDEWISDLIDNNYEKFNHDFDGNYNSFKDFKRLCNFATLEFENAYNVLRALSHGEYWNAHVGTTYLKLMIHEKDTINGT